MKMFTHIFLYSATSDSLRYQETICPLSLDHLIENDSMMQINNCAHSFKEKALREHFKIHANCPVCGLIVPHSDLK